MNCKHSLADLAQAIRQEEKFAICAHVKPDGDSVGGCVAVYLMLRSLGKNAKLLLNDNIPEKYNDLIALVDKDDFVRLPAPKLPEWVLFGLDAGTFDRLGDTQMEDWKAVFFLDHHETGKPFGDVCVVNAAAAATSELIFDLCGLLEVPMTKALAQALFTGVCADTGNFKFSNTTAHTLEVAAALMDTGIEHSEIARRLFEVRSERSSRMLGYLLSNFKTIGDTVIYTPVPLNFIREQGIQNEDFDGLINFLTNTEPYKVAMVLKETEAFEVSLNFRSNTDDYNVGQLAERLGGGGHKRASGATLQGTTLSGAEAKALAIMQEMFGL